MLFERGRGHVGASARTKWRAFISLKALTNVRTLLQSLFIQSAFLSHLQLILKFRGYKSYQTVVKYLHIGPELS